MLKHLTVSIVLMVAVLKAIFMVMVLLTSLCIVTAVKGFGMEPG